MDMDRGLFVCLLLMVVPDVGMGVYSDLDSADSQDGGGSLDLEPVSMVAFSNDEAEIRSASFVIFKKLSNAEMLEKAKSIRVQVKAVADQDIIAIEPQNQTQVITPPKNLRGPAMFEIFCTLKLKADTTKLQKTVTGDLNVTFIIKTDLDPDLCEGGCHFHGVVYNETKILSVTTSTSRTLQPEANGQYTVPVNVSKSLDTLYDLELSVTLRPADSTEYSPPKEVSLKKEEKMASVIFDEVPAGEYSVSVTCAENCNGLKDVIRFSSVPTIIAHDPFSVLQTERAILRNEKKAFCCLECTGEQEPIDHAIDDYCNCSLTRPSCGPTITSTIAPTEKTTTISSTTALSKSSSSAIENGDTNDGDTSDGTTSQPSESYWSAHYMELAVGGLIAVLILSLLGYLLYHYRVKVKEWVCSNKDAVSSNLSRPSLTSTLRRVRGGRYTKLPHTMQEALHQD